MCIVALNIWPVPPTDFASRVIPSIEGPVDGFLRHDTTGGESDDRFRDQKKKERDRELPVLYKYTQSSRTLSTIVQVCKYKVIKKPFSTNNMNFRPVRFFVVFFFPNALHDLRRQLLWEFDPPPTTCVSFFLAGQGKKN